VHVQGDEVEVKGGKLYINGAKQDEPFTAEDAAYDFGPVTVPSGNVLVLGDNRNHSLDGASNNQKWFQSYLCMFSAFANLVCF
jgi:signal peptidase I